MIKYAIYLDDIEKLVISEFKDVGYKSKEEVIKGAPVYEYIRKISKNNIINIYESQNEGKIILECKNSTINLIGYEALFKKNGMKPILNNIKDYFEKQKIKNTKKKKVARINKYSGKRFVAGGLALIVLGGCSIGLFKKHSSASIVTNDVVIKTSNPEFNYDDSIKIEYDTETNISNVETEYKEGINIPNVEIEVPKEEVKMVSIDYEDRSSTTKASNAKENYYGLIDKYSKMYGLDSNLVLGVATQERGVHSTKMDPGGATGLMQIQNSVWLNQEVTAYNFELGRNETIKIDSNKIKNLETNIKLGCMILQNCFRYMKYNPLVSIQCYNMGYGNMRKILDTYSYNSNKSIDEILSDVYDTGWMEYRNLIKVGDQNYVENVLSWIGSDIELHIVDRNGQLIDLAINNELNNNKVY